MEFYYICKDCKHINITEDSESPPDSCEECGNSEMVRGIEIVKQMWEGKKNDKAKKRSIFK